MRNRLITVFGGTGFIGRHLVRRLAARGARVLVISRNPSRGYHLQPMGRVGQIVVRRVDLGNEQALARALAGASGVVNLIGILHETRQQRFDEVQGALPGRIARAAADAGIERMVQLSAIGADPGSKSAYARSKAEGERRVREALPERHDRAAEHRDRPRGRLLQPLRRDGALAAGAAADRRRQDPVPAGLCRRRGGRDRRRAASAPMPPARPTSSAGRRSTASPS